MIERVEDLVEELKSIVRDRLCVRIGRIRVMINRLRLSSPRKYRRKTLSTYRQLYCKFYESYVMSVYVCFTTRTK